MHRRDQAGAETSEIASLVRLEGRRVLDVAARVYAFDPNSERVAQARSSLLRAQAPRVPLAVHEIAALDVGRERFDIALCGWSL
jgi:16S rRNA C967 or C1407 C5-methylase (RsmB/RsmF family)